MPEFNFIVIAASNGERFKQSDDKLNDDVKILYASELRIRHFQGTKRLIHVLRKAVDMNPKKGIIICADVLLNSISLASHQINDPRHTNNVMTPQEVIKELNMLVKLCHAEDAEPVIAPNW